ncbi:MAG: hypothetical protein [Microviridae sp.]|nr:MAG: hypothetical protein [Microviridae sp.]
MTRQRHSCPCLPKLVRSLTMILRNSSNLLRMKVTTTNSVNGASWSPSKWLKSRRPCGSLSRRSIPLLSPQSPHSGRTHSYP